MHLAILCNNYLQEMDKREIRSKIMCSTSRWTISMFTDRAWINLLYQRLLPGHSQISIHWMIKKEKKRREKKKKKGKMEWKNFYFAYFTLQSFIFAVNKYHCYIRITFLPLIQSILSWYHDKLLRIMKNTAYLRI